MLTWHQLSDYTTPLPGLWNQTWRICTHANLQFHRTTTVLKMCAIYVIIWPVYRAFVPLKGDKTQIYVHLDRAVKSAYKNKLRKTQVWNSSGDACSWRHGMLLLRVHALSTQQIPCLHHITVHVCVFTALRESQSVYLCLFVQLRLRENNCTANNNTRDWRIEKAFSSLHQFN